MLESLMLTNVCYGSPSKFVNFDNKLVLLLTLVAYPKKEELLSPRMSHDTWLCYLASFSILSKYSCSSSLSLFVVLSFFSFNGSSSNACAAHLRLLTFPWVSFFRLMVILTFFSFLITQNSGLSHAL